MNSLSFKAFAFVDQWVPASQRFDSDEVSLKTRIVYIFMFFAVLFSFGMGSLRFLRGDQAIGVVTLIFGFLGAFTSVIHRIFKSLKVAAFWLICLMTLLLTGLALVSGGVFAPAGLWYGPLVVFILVILGFRTALVWVLGLGLHSFILFWLPRHGFVLPDIHNAARDITWTIAIPASLIFTVSLLYGFFQAHQHAIVALDLQAKALALQAKELLEAKDMAEAATRVRGEFIAIISHEIRTPMNGILGVAQLLKGSSHNPEFSTYLQALNQSAEGLLSILNDLLDFSKIEAGKMEVQMKPFNLRHLCNESIALFSAIAKTKNIRLTLEFQDALPINVLGDPTRISQVLNNLVGNAIKFTDNGYVTLRVSTAKRDPGSLNFSIQDSGIGMSASTIEHLFKPYTQADSSYSRKFGGTGLGLAISHRLIEMMQGKIWAESVLNQGSTFFIQIPLAETDSVPPSALVKLEPPPESPPVNLDQRKVLLVEDNAVNRMIAIKMLEKFGLLVEVAFDGKEAVEKWQGGSFDLIFMDCHMPTMDGYEASRIIRAQERLRGDTRRIPIVALTAQAMEEDRQRCLDAGMDGYLTKPVKSEALKEALQTWILKM